MTESMRRQCIVQVIIYIYMGSSLSLFNMADNAKVVEISMNTPS